jgi:hypothetical protein
LSLHHHQFCHNFFLQNNSNLWPVWKWRDNDWRSESYLWILPISHFLSRYFIVVSPRRPSLGISVQNQSIYGMFLKKNWLGTVYNSTLWITPTIIMQCNLKRALYLLSQKYNISKIKKCYKALCKSLSKIVLEAKQSYYNNLFSTSNNKISATWKITETITGRTNLNDGINTIYVNGNLTDNPQFISESFNSYFLSTADKIVNKMQIIRDS